MKKELIGMGGMDSCGGEESRNTSDILIPLEEFKRIEEDVRNKLSEDGIPEKDRDVARLITLIKLGVGAVSQERNKRKTLLRKKPKL